MRATAEVKRKRLRKLLEAIREKGMLDIHQARKTLNNKVSLRMVRNYLDDLRELQLITYDAKNQSYRAISIQKKEFNSKYDYDLAICHSLNVFKPLQTVDIPTSQLHFSPFELDKLISFQEKLPELIQHLKTGYFADFWIPLEKLRKFMEEHDYPQLHLTYSPGVDVGVGYGQDIIEKIKENEKKIGSKTWKEMTELAQIIIGKLNFLIRDIEEGIPLLGNCDRCPSERITIKA